MKFRRVILLAIAAVGLAGCETLVAPRYSVTGDNNLAVKALGASGIGVGEFTGPPSFEANCRALGPLQVADGISHTQYIRRAFEEEFKIAGVFAATSPRVMLTGSVTRLEFSSMRGLTGGSWDIDLTVYSSNGHSIKASERYEFHSGFTAPTACKQTAEAYAPAVQNLLGTIFRSTEFLALVRPSGAAAPAVAAGQSKKDSVRGFIVSSYGQLVADLARGSGNFQNSLVAMLELGKNEEAAALRRIKGMSEAFPDPAQFAGQVAEAFVKPAAVVAAAERPAAPVAQKPAAATASGNRLPSANSRLPIAGDTWTYRLSEPKREDGPKQRSYVVKVASVMGGEIRDELLLDNVAAGVVVHSDGSYLVAQGASIFSPYLNVFRQPMSHVGEIDLRDEVACKPPYGCAAEGRFAGPETITTPAGSFETLKVVIVHSWYPTSPSHFVGQMRGSRILTVWYSPLLKRAVRFASQPKIASFAPIDPEFVLELVAYQLQ